MGGKGDGSPYARCFQPVDFFIAIIMHGRYRIQLDGTKMGFRICYLAAQIDPRAMAKAFNLPIVEQSLGMPLDYWWVARIKQTGWSILWSESETFGQDNLPLLNELSDITNVLLCEVNEGFMWSSAYCWSKGEVIWQVSHHGDTGDVFDIVTAGQLPDVYSTMKDKIVNLQGEAGEDVDLVFSLPSDLVASFVGFEYDKYLQPEEVDEFLILGNT
jgi:hypothetical protein